MLLKRVTRRSQDLRCPLCHDEVDLGDSLVACSRCKTVAHHACFDELGGCATLACRSGRAKPLRRTRAPLLGILLVLLPVVPLGLAVRLAWPSVERPETKRPEPQKSRERAKPALVEMPAPVGETVREAPPPIASPPVALPSTFSELSFSIIELRGSSVTLFVSDDGTARVYRSGKNVELARREKVLSRSALRGIIEAVHATVELPQLLAPPPPYEPTPYIFLRGRFAGREFDTRGSVESGEFSRVAALVGALKKAVAEVEE